MLLNINLQDSKQGVMFNSSSYLHVHFLLRLRSSVAEHWLCSHGIPSGAKRMSQTTYILTQEMSAAFVVRLGWLTTTRNYLIPCYDFMPYSALVEG